MSPKPRPGLVADLVEEYQQTRQALTEWETAHAETLAERSRLQRDLHKLHELADYAVGDGPCPIHNTHHHETETRDGPSTRTRIETIIEEQGPMTISQMVDALTRDGWVTTSTDPRGVVRTNVARSTRAYLENGTITATPKG